MLISALWDEQRGDLLTDWHLSCRPSRQNSLIVLIVLTGILIIDYRCWYVAVRFKQLPVLIMIPETRHSDKRSCRQLLCGVWLLHCSVWFLTRHISERHKKTANAGKTCRVEVHSSSLQQLDVKLMVHFMSAANTTCCTEWCQPLIRKMFRTTCWTSFKPQLNNFSWIGVK